MTNKDTNKDTSKDPSKTPYKHTDPRVCSPDREYTPEPTPVMDALREAAKRSRSLLSFQFNVTERCNLKCRHCYRAPEQVSPCPDPTTQQVVDIMQQANNMGALFCAFSGGEPLLRDDWPELFQEARRLKMGVTLMTNGTLLNEKNLKTLIDLNPGLVRISLYGATPQTHDQFTRIEGSFNKSLESAEELAKAGVRVRITSIATRQNAVEMEDLFDKSVSIGAFPSVGLRIMPCINGKYCDKELFLEEEQLSKLFKIPELRNLVNPKRKNEEKSWDALPYCGSGKTSLCINADLTVWPCTNLPVELGDLKTNTLSEIWKDHPYIKYFQTLRRGKDLKDECRLCEYRASCSRCPGAAMLAGNEIHGKEPGCCKVAKTLHILKKKSREKLIDDNPGSSHIIEASPRKNNTAPTLEKEGAF